MKKLISMIKDIIQTRAWVDFKRPVIISSLFLLISLLIYLVVLHPQFVGWLLARSEEIRSRQTVEKYQKFGDLMKNIKAQGEGAEAVVNAVTSGGALDEKSEERFFEIINNCADQSGANVSKAVPVVLDGDRPGMMVVFSASFSQLNSFIHLLEKSCRIDTLSITGGRTSNRHKVELTVLDLVRAADLTAVRNAAIDRCGGEDIFKLSGEVGRLLESINKRRDIINAYSSPSRDIFMYEDTVYFVAKSAVPTRKTRTAPPAERPKIKIDQIFYDAQAPVVIIDGKAMQTGDTLGEITIVAINEKSIVVKFRGSNHTITQ